MAALNKILEWISDIASYFKVAIGKLKLQIRFTLYLHWTALGERVDILKEAEHS